LCAPTPRATEIRAYAEVMMETLASWRSDGPRPPFSEYRMNERATISPRGLSVIRPPARRRAIRPAVERPSRNGMRELMA